MKLIYKIERVNLAFLLLSGIGLYLYGFAEAHLYKVSDSYEYIDAL